MRYPAWPQVCWVRFSDKRLERMKGIEPSYSAWEAAVLPLYYIRSDTYFNNFLKKCQGV